MISPVRIDEFCYPKQKINVESLWTRFLILNQSRHKEIHSKTQTGVDVVYSRLIKFVGTQKSTDKTITLLETIAKIHFNRIDL